MHEPGSSDPQHISPIEPTLAPEPPRPSRLIPFLGFGTVSGALFAVGGALRRGDDPVSASVSDFSYLGACLSGVAAAIFGCVTVVRALRKRSADGPE